MIARSSSGFTTVMSESRMVTTRKSDSQSLYGLA
jgi:hypothetical protein